MQPNLKKNYVYRTFYEVLILLTPFITTPYVARILGADGTGNYSFTHSIISYFMMVGALGTVGYGTREIARVRDDKYKVSKLFWEIELMTVMTVSFCLLVWLGFILFSTTYKYYFLVLTPFLFSTMFDIHWLFSGLERVKNIVIRNTVVKFAGIILLFILVRKKEDILIYCLINSATAMIGSLSMWVYLPKMLVKVNFRELTFKHHFHETLIYFIPTIASSVYTILDKTLIGAITGSSYQNGYYEQATKIIKLVKSVVFVGLNSVMGARISYLFAEERIEEIKKRMKKSISLIFLLSYGAIFGIIGISSKFVPVFFGDGYEPVITLLYLMSPLILIIGISNCLGKQYYTPSGQRKRSAKIILLGSAVNLIFNLIFIPRLGAYGATIASIIAESVISVIYVQMSAGYMTWRIIWEATWRRLIAGGIMCALVFGSGEMLASQSVWVIFAQFLIGCFSYTAILYLLHDSMLAELIQLVQKHLRKVMKRAGKGKQKRQA